MNEAYIKEAIARELSREIRIQNARGKLADHEEVEAYLRYYNLSLYFAREGHDRHL